MECICVYEDGSERFTSVITQPFGIPTRVINEDGPNLFEFLSDIIFGVFDFIFFFFLLIFPPLLTEVNVKEMHNKLRPKDFVC
jgi:hypothetical protein